MFRTTPTQAVRGMLRAANDPVRLAPLPIVRELCSLTGRNDPREMLDDVIASAFNDTPQERRLREILLESEDCSTVAQRFNLSLRHFHRMRSHAVCLVSLRVQDILDCARLEDPKGPVDDLLLLARSQLHAGARRSTVRATLSRAKDAVRSEIPDATEASRFELASLEFELALRESSLSAMNDALRAMRAHSRLRRDFELRRHLALAAFFLRSGQPAQADAVYEEISAAARAMQDVRSIAMCAALHAELSLVHGRYDDAEASARAAAIALRDDENAFAIAFLRARIAAARGEGWDARESLRQIPERTFEHAAVTIFTSRFLLNAGDTQGAERLAMRGYNDCLEQLFAGLLATAYVALGAVEDAKGNQQVAAGHYLLALRSIMATADRVIAFAAFSGAGVPRRRCGPFETPELCVKACLSRLRFLLAASPHHIDWDALEPVIFAVADAALDGRHLPLSLEQAAAVRDLMANNETLVRDSAWLAIAVVLPVPDRETFLRTFFEIISQRE